MNLQGIKQRYGIIGTSEALDNALSTAVRVAPTDLTVLISGESGVGKEVFSKVIHSLSARKHNAFIAINCGAIPAGTINSELFGHEKGAFTGASAERKGYFESVNGGTIFLDEVAEMPADTQAFLLRVLETGEFIRVGSSVVRKTDVRVIAATNVDLLERIRAGKFREDLYYRMNTVPINVPALRERKGDISVLFRKFTVDSAERYRTTPVRPDDDATKLLQNYGWPGNIRELKNIAEQSTVLSEQKVLTAEGLLKIAPQLKNQPGLPAMIRARQSEGGFEEREILYKLLFDMKNDLNDLKSVVQGLISENDLEMSKDIHISTLEAGTNLPEKIEGVQGQRSPQYDFNRPAYRDREDTRQDFDEAEVVDDNLSLEDMERQFIQKALDKHAGRRRDAAKELGISERTLYRKIKEYELG